MKTSKPTASPPVDRVALIESLTTSIKYSQAQRLVDQIMAIAPYAPDELQRMVAIAEGEGTRWEPPRITFYQHLLAGLEPDTPLAVRLKKLLQRARADLISRPTRRTALDARGVGSTGLARTLKKGPEAGLTGSTKMTAAGRATSTDVLAARARRME